MNPIIISGDRDRIKFLIYTRLTDPNQTPATTRQIYEFLEDELDIKPGGLYRDRILRRSIRTWIEQVADFITAHYRTFRKPRYSQRRPAESPLSTEYRQLRKQCSMNKITVDRLYLSELSLVDKVAVLRDHLSESAAETSGTDQKTPESSTTSPIVSEKTMQAIREKRDAFRKRKQTFEDNVLELSGHQSKRSSVSSCASEKSFDDFDMFRSKPLISNLK